MDKRASAPAQTAPPSLVLAAFLPATIQFATRLFFYLGVTEV
jgi:hypothetical protein